jgi:hypothetical protein
MTPVRNALRLVFERLERLLDRAFPPAWQPLYHLGALGFFFYWIVAVSGIYLYIFFDTGVAAALRVGRVPDPGAMVCRRRYAQPAPLRFRRHGRGRGAAPAARVFARPLPRAALVHLGHRRANFSARGGVGHHRLLAGLGQTCPVRRCGDDGGLDRLPIFGQSIARNFLSPDTLDDRFFTLWVFMHIVLPLLLLLCSGLPCSGSVGRRSIRRAVSPSAFSS